MMHKRRSSMANDQKQDAIETLISPGASQVMIGT